MTVDTITRHELPDLGTKSTEELASMIIERTDVMLALGARVGHRGCVAINAETGAGGLLTPEGSLSVGRAVEVCTIADVLARRLR